MLYVYRCRVLRSKSFGKVCFNYLNYVATMTTLSYTLTILNVILHLDLMS